MKKEILLLGVLCILLVACAPAHQGPTPTPTPDIGQWLEKNYEKSEEILKEEKDQTYYLRRLVELAEKGVALLEGIFKKTSELGTLAGKTYTRIAGINITNVMIWIIVAIVAFLLWPSRKSKGEK